MTKTAVKIGTITQVHRFPVKSMRGESLSEVRVHAGGLTGDRVYAFVDPAKSANFPWLTAREVAEMILFQPRFNDQPASNTPFPDIRHYQVTVRTPEGTEHPVDDPGFLDSLQKRWKRTFSLRFSERGQPDAAPVSILGLKSIESLSQDAGLKLDPLRFRPNLLVDWLDATPYFEDSLVGMRVQVGDQVELSVTSRDTRCTIINLEPRDAAPNPGVLKTVGSKRKGCVGVYGAVLRDGVIRAGDSIFRL